MNQPQKNQNYNTSASNFVCPECVSLKCSISKLQNELNLKTAECTELHSLLDSQKEKYENEKQSTLEKISDLEKQLQDFKQKHGILEQELFSNKKTIQTYKYKFANKCAALSKAKLKKKQ